MILVTGAAGKTGQAIIQNLAASGQIVRGFVRREKQKRLLEHLGASEIVIGDISDQAALFKAAKGVKVIYHICPNMHPEEVLIGEIIIRAAQSAGVERIVYHSVLHPQIESMPHHWHKMRVEEMLFESGLSYTILQPAAYMQNVLANWGRIVSEGVYAVPYGLDTRLSMVDLRDVAEAVSKVIREPGHEGAIYELCGREILSQKEIAGILGEQLNQKVVGEVIALERWEHQARFAGLSDYAVQTLVSMFQYYERHGFWGNSQVLTWLLGRLPANFAQFVHRTINEQGAF